MRFAGRHVVITGSSTGVGRATAERVAAEGGRVTLLARRADVLDLAHREIGDPALTMSADVGDKAFEAHSRSTC